MFLSTKAQFTQFLWFLSSVLFLVQDSPQDPAGPLAVIFPYVTLVWDLFFILTLFFDEHLFFNTCLISTPLSGPEQNSNKSMPSEGLVFRREFIIDSLKTNALWHITI